MKIYILLLISFLFCNVSTQAQDLASLKHEVDQMIKFDYDMDLQEGEGLWIGVIDGDSTFIFKLGNIEEDSLAEFQLGSVSKIFTYNILKKQMLENNVQAESALPLFIELDESYESISIQDLLDHKSGLPKDPYFFGRRSTNPENPYENYPDSIIAEQLNVHSKLFPADNDFDFAYGHLNYALAGIVSESLTQKSYCDLVDESYAQKYPSLKCSDQSTKLIAGLDKSNYPAQPWVFPGFAASTGLSSNIIDLTNYIRTELYANTSDNTYTKISRQLSFQAPWYIVTIKKHQTYSFSGTTSTHSVFVCFDKESESAVVMMRNSGKGILHLPLTILDMVKSSKAKSK